METPVRAVSRVCPFVDGEICNGKNNGHSSAVEAAPAASQIILGQDHFCDFDAVFGADVSQKELYAACLEDLVQHFWQGYNVSVVGYGSSRSGKTYTITGPGFLWAMNEEEFGLLPRAVRQLYTHIAEHRDAGGGMPEVRVSVSYLMLCGGAVYDLLTGQSHLTPLPVLSDHKGSVMVPGLSSVDCSNITEVLNCLEAGLLARNNHLSPGASTVQSAAGGSIINDVLVNDNLSVKHVAVESRRHKHDCGGASTHRDSHASFTITLQQRKVANDGRPFIVCSRLNFVDLGGIEEIKSSSTTLNEEPSMTSSLMPGSSSNGYYIHPPQSVTLHSRDPSAVGSTDSNLYSNTEVLGGVTALMKSADSRQLFEAEESHGSSAEVMNNMDDSKENICVMSQSQKEDFLLAKENPIIRSHSDAEFFKRRFSGEFNSFSNANEALNDDEDVASLSADGKDYSLMTADHQCLADVIKSLVNRNHVGSVPYARSMLTQLLKESLGGNCLTLLVCCASPRQEDLPATLVAMKYGGLARYIINRPRVNDITSEVAALLADAQPTTSSGGAFAEQLSLETSREIRNSEPHTEASLPTYNLITSPTFSNNASNTSNAITQDTTTAATTNTITPNTIASNTTTITSNTISPNLNVNNTNANLNTSSRGVYTQGLTPEEIFRLQFGSNQLQQLVDAADSLLRSCLPFLPAVLQSQAGAWLYRRSETQHCLGGSITPHFPATAMHLPQQLDVFGGVQLAPHGFTGPMTESLYRDPRYWGQVNHLPPGLLSRDDRTLHVIEELSEPGDLKTSSRNTSSAAAAAPPNAAAGCSDNASSCGSCDSSNSSLGEEFHEQLAVLVTNFGEKTSLLVGAVEDRLDVFSEMMTSPDASSEEEEGAVNVGTVSIEKMDTERSLSDNEANVVPAPSDAALHNYSLKESNVLHEVHPTASTYQDLHEDLLDGSSAEEDQDLQSEDSDMDMDSCESDSSSSDEGEDVVAAVNATPSRRRNASCEAAGIAVTAQQLWLADHSTAPLALHAKEANKRRQRELRETIKEKECQLRSMQRGAAEKEELLRQNREKLVGLQRLIDRDTILLAQAQRRAQSCRNSSTATAAVQQLQQALQQYELRVKAINYFNSIIEATKTPVEEVAKVSARVQELRSELEELHTIVRTGEQRQQQLQHLARNRVRKAHTDPHAAGDDADGETVLVELPPSPAANIANFRALGGYDSRTEGNKSRDENLAVSRAAEDVSFANGPSSDVNDNSNCASAVNHLRTNIATGDGIGVRSPTHTNSGVMTGNVNTSDQNKASTPLVSDLKASGGMNGHGVFGTRGPNTSSAEKPATPVASHPTAVARRTGKSSTKAVVSLQGLSQPHKRRLVTSSSEQVTSSQEGGSEVATARQAAVLRQEVAALRDARNALIAYRQRLSKKIQKGVRESRRWEAERRFMEVDEAIEAVDSSIEQKNELICGSATLLHATSSTLLLQGKLLDRLLNLSLDEIRALMVKYFSRVIDIRIEFRKQEIAYTELELQFEDQSRLLQKLEWSYEQASLDMERRCAVQQRHFLHYLHKLFRHIDAQETAMQLARETALPFTLDADSDKFRASESDVRQLEMNLYYYKQQCQQLKTLVRQQQGLGYDFQPLFQQQLLQQQQQLQLRQPCDDSKKEKTDTGRSCGERRTGIGSRLATLGPGASIFSPPLDHNSGGLAPSQRLEPQQPQAETSRHRIASPDEPTLAYAPDYNPPALPVTSAAFERNTFTRNVRPQPRLRHRRPPASRSSKYRDWGAHKSADHPEDVESIALSHMPTAADVASAHGAPAASNIRSSRAVPNKWR